MTHTTTGSGWSGVAEAYRDTFAVLCAGTTQAVLDAAGLLRRSGTDLRVLDVGAGTGALAAAALATGAQVTAVDPDPEMLHLAAATAPAARLQQSGLPDLPFGDDSFDVVLANFVVNHLQDPRAGVRELARVVRPGGRLVVTIWPSGLSAQSQLWAAVIEESGAEPVVSARLPADKDFPRTVDGLRELCAGAGLRQVSTESVQWEHRADADFLWRGASAGIAGIGATVQAQTPAVRDRMKVAYDRLVGALLVGDELRLPTEALLAVGTKP